MILNFTNQYHQQSTTTIMITILMNQKAINNLQKRKLKSPTASPLATIGGICIKHGSRYKYRRYYCSIEGCIKYPKQEEFIKVKGAKFPLPLCSIEGCTNFETNKGIYIQHGAQVKLGMYQAGDEGEVFWSYGAKFTKIKKKGIVENCETVASRSRVCVKHRAKLCKARWSMLCLWSKTGEA